MHDLVLSDSALQQYGKSFSWASRFFAKDTRQSITRLYAFCRALDDWVDHSVANESGQLDTELNWLQTCLCFQYPHPLINPVSSIKSAYGLPTDAFIDLVQGVQRDLKPARIYSPLALVAYSYLVAGSVGRLMMPLLGVSDRTATPYAIALGIAMQMSNIARDIGEDSALGRIYLPIAWHGCQTPDHLSIAAVSLARSRLVTLSDGFYDLATKGLSFIPLRNRLPIAIALKLYQAIGHLADKNPHLSQRVSTTWGHKIGLTLSGILSTMRPMRRLPHATLEILPGALSIPEHTDESALTTALLPNRLRQCLKPQ